MSGKRQHFIPRFLQEGFQSHKMGVDTFTWMYRKEANPFNPNIKNVGVEGYFYQKGDDKEVDNFITNFEGNISVLVQKLRSSDHSVITNSQIPELIAHLEVRTRHIRENILQTGDYLLTRFLEFIEDEQSFMKAMEKWVREDPSMLRKAFSSELGARGLPSEFLEPLLGATTSNLALLK